MDDGSKMLTDFYEKGTHFFYHNLLIVFFFTGTEMDYVEDNLSAEFVFNNPNIKGTCGCGESFSI